MSAHLQPPARRCTGGRRATRRCPTRASWRSTGSKPVLGRDESGDPTGLLSVGLAQLKGHRCLPAFLLGRISRRPGAGVPADASAKHPARESITVGHFDGARASSPSGMIEPCRTAVDLGERGSRDLSLMPALPPAYRRMTWILPSGSGLPVGTRRTRAADKTPRTGVLKGPTVTTCRAADHQVAPTLGEQNVRS